MKIAFKARPVAQVFGVVVFCLVLAHIVVQTIRFSTGDERLFGLVSFFSLGAENNLPTFYSSFAILFCAFLLALIGLVARRNESRWFVHWFFLALVFTFLSLDESMELHERLIGPMRSIFVTDGFLHYAWVIPYSIGLALLAAAYTRFLFHIPRRSAILFIFAGVLFVSGALVMELISGRVYQAAGSKNILYVVVQTLEETLEMSGIVIFIFALIDYIEKSIGQLRLILGHD